MLKKNKKLAVAFAIVLIAYNVVLFSISGFGGHSAIFRISWIFMLLAFGVLGVFGLIMNNGIRDLRDWIFGYPIIKHCTIYIIIEFVLSTLCMIFDKHLSLTLVFTVQFILIAVYLLLVVSCFFAKQKIEEVHDNISARTKFIKLLQADAEMLCEKCEDKDLKAKCAKLAEDIRFSDPMSCSALGEIENELKNTIDNCGKAISEKNFSEAEALCDKASLLLVERNKKCKILK